MAPRFQELGWRIHRGLVMAHRRPPERTADTGLVEEVADAVDWPRLRSGRLGFVGLGRYVKLIRPG